MEMALASFSSRHTGRASILVPVPVLLAHTMRRAGRGRRPHYRLADVCASAGIVANVPITHNTNSMDTQAAATSLNYATRGAITAWLRCQAHWAPTHTACLAAGQLPAAGAPCKGPARRAQPVISCQRGAAPCKGQVSELRWSRRRRGGWQAAVGASRRGGADLCEIRGQPLSTPVLVSQVACMAQRGKGVHWLRARHTGGAALATEKP